MEAKEGPLLPQLVKIRSKHSSDKFFIAVMITQLLINEELYGDRISTVCASHSQMFKVDEIHEVTLFKCGKCLRRNLHCRS